MTNFKRWSDAKLDKEWAFALAAADPYHKENINWLVAIANEIARRKAA